MMQNEKLGAGNTDLPLVLMDNKTPAATSSDVLQDGKKERKSSTSKKRTSASSSSPAPQAKDIPPLNVNSTNTVNANHHQVTQTSNVNQVNSTTSNSNSNGATPAVSGGGRGGRQRSRGSFFTTTSAGQNGVPLSEHQERCLEGLASLLQQMKIVLSPSTEKIFPLRNLLTALQEDLHLLEPGNRGGSYHATCAPRALVLGPEDSHRTSTLNFMLGRDGVGTDANLTNLGNTFNDVNSKSQRSISFVTEGILELEDYSPLAASIGSEVPLHSHVPSPPGISSRVFNYNQNSAMEAQRRNSNQSPTTNPMADNTGNHNTTSSISNNNYHGDSSWTSSPPRSRYPDLSGLRGGESPTTWDSPVSPSVLQYDAILNGSSTGDLSRKALAVFPSTFPNNYNNNISTSAIAVGSEAADESNFPLSPLSEGRKRRGRSGSIWNSGVSGRLRRKPVSITPGVLTTSVLDRLESSEEVRKLHLEAEAKGGPPQQLSAYFPPPPETNMTRVFQREPSMHSAKTTGPASLCSSGVDFLRSIYSLDSQNVPPLPPPPPPNGAGTARGSRSWAADEIAGAALSDSNAPTPPPPPPPTASAATANGTSALSYPLGECAWLLQESEDCAVRWDDRAAPVQLPAAMLSDVFFLCIPVASFKNNCMHAMSLLFPPALNCPLPPSPVANHTNIGGGGAVEKSNAPSRRSSKMYNPPSIAPTPPAGTAATVDVHTPAMVQLLRQAIVSQSFFILTGTEVLSPSDGTPTAAASSPLRPKVPPIPEALAQLVQEFIARMWDLYNVTVRPWQVVPFSGPLSWVTRDFLAAMLLAAEGKINTTNTTTGHSKSDQNPSDSPKQSPVPLCNSSPTGSILKKPTDTFSNGILTPTASAELSPSSPIMMPALLPKSILSPNTSLALPYPTMAPTVPKLSDAVKNYEKEIQMNPEIFSATETRSPKQKKKEKSKKKSNSKSNSDVGKDKKKRLSIDSTASSSSSKRGSLSGTVPSADTDTRSTAAVTTAAIPAAPKSTATGPEEREKIQQMYLHAKCQMWLRSGASSLYQSLRDFERYSFTFVLSQGILSVMLWSFQLMQLLPKAAEASAARVTKTHERLTMLRQRQKSVEETITYHRNVSPYARMLSLEARMQDIFSTLTGKFLLDLRRLFILGEEANEIDIDVHPELRAAHKCLTSCALHFRSYYKDQQVEAEAALLNKKIAHLQKELKEAERKGSNANAAPTPPSAAGNGESRKSKKKSKDQSQEGGNIIVANAPSNVSAAEIKTSSLQDTEAKLKECLETRRKNELQLITELSQINTEIINYFIAVCYHSIPIMCSFLSTEVVEIKKELGCIFTMIAQTKMPKEEIPLEYYTRCMDGWKAEELLRLPPEGTWREFVTGLRAALCEDQVRALAKFRTVAAGETQAQERKLSTSSANTKNKHAEESPQPLKPSPPPSKRAASAQPKAASTDTNHKTVKDNSSSNPINHNPSKDSKSNTPVSPPPKEPKLPAGASPHRPHQGRKNQLQPERQTPTPLSEENLENIKSTLDPPLSDAQRKKSASGETKGGVPERAASAQPTASAHSPMRRPIAKPVISPPSKNKNNNDANNNNRKDTTVNTNAANTAAKNKPSTLNGDGEVAVSATDEVITVIESTSFLPSKKSGFTADSRPEDYFLSPRASRKNSENHGDHSSTTIQNRNNNNNNNSNNRRNSNTSTKGDENLNLSGVPKVTAAPLSNHGQAASGGTNDDSTAGVSTDEPHPNTYFLSHRSDRWMHKWFSQYNQRNSASHSLHTSPNSKQRQSNSMSNVYSTSNNNFSYHGWNAELEDAPFYADELPPVAFPSLSDAPALQRTRRQTAAMMASPDTVAINTVVANAMRMNTNSQGLEGGEGGGGAAAAMGSFSSSPLSAASTGVDQERQKRRLEELHTLRQKTPPALRPRQFSEAPLLWVLLDVWEEMLRATPFRAWFDLGTLEYGDQLARVSLPLLASQEWWSQEIGEMIEDLEMNADALEREAARLSTPQKRGSAFSTLQQVFDHSVDLMGRLEAARSNVLTSSFFGSRDNN